NASASYWYQFLPDWNAQKDVEGPVAFNGEWPDDFDYVLEDITSDDNMNLNRRSVKGEEAYQYTRDYSDQNLGHISANIGFKVWFGNSKKEEAPQPNDKDLFITVKDEPTGYALSGVAVTVYKDGEPFYSGVTNDNGAIPTIGDVAPGNYTIKGELNNIETSTSHIEESDFSGESRVIKRTLSHKDLRFTLAGQTLYEETGAPFPDVATTLRQVKSGETVHQVSDKDGEFKYQLDPDTDFTVYAEHEGYFSNRKEITTKDLDRSKTLYVDLRLELGELKEGAEFELKNIYYDFDKSDIRPDAAKVLNDLYNMMVDNPAIKIELSSHTDSRGSDTYNKELSQRRADSAVEYLIDKGLARDRLVAKGYGESKLVNECTDGVACSEEQHQENRRTEIKVLKD